MAGRNDAVAEMFVNLRGDVTKLKQDIANLAKSTKTQTAKIESSFKDTFRRIGRNTAAFFGITSAVALVTRTLSAMISTFKNFDREMQNVNTIIGVSAQQLKVLKNEIVGLSRSVGADATELAQGLYQATSAGVQAGEAIEFMGTAARAAKAGLATVKTSVDGITTVINAWHLSARDATKVSDVMFQTVKLGKTTFGELAQSISIVANIAASSGVSFEQISGAVATLTKQGVPTSVAMTQLRQAIIALNEQLGDGWTKSMSLIEGMEALRKKVGYSNVALKEMVGRVEGVNGILGLTGKNASVAADDFEAMRNAVGASAKAFAEQTKSLDFQTEKLGQVIKDVFIRTMTALLPVISAVNRGLQSFADFLLPTANALQQERLQLITTAKAAQSYKEGTVARKDAIESLKQQYPTLLSYLDSEKSSNEDLKKAMDDINKLYLERARRAAIEASISKLTKDVVDAYVELEDIQNKITTSYEALNGEASATGKSFEEMAEAVNKFRTTQTAARGGPLAELIQKITGGGLLNYTEASKKATEADLEFEKRIASLTEKLRQQDEILDQLNPKVDKAGEDFGPVATEWSTTTEQQVKIKPKVIPMSDDEKEELLPLTEEDIAAKFKDTAKFVKEQYYNIGTAAVEGFASSGVNAIWHSLSQNMRKEAGIVNQIIVGMVDSILSELQRLLAVKVLTKLAEGPLSFLSLTQHGGSIQATPGGYKKMQAGGSFNVPFGFQNDQYPIMVESGERLDVTTRGRNSNQEILLQDLIRRVEALSMNTLTAKQPQSEVDINLQGSISGGDIKLTYDKADRYSRRSG